ncbi:hypothetical protein VMCG_08320 [Cytospora schulzeri]|uniref:Peptidase A1 domain-containing protein n=1 Tax=Cytospora schulzeri TaxID=448051 RepID=A0A423VVF8_9PEZI|nr:hypothetical protein VMCG_08320 [Valsa malicola]
MKTYIRLALIGAFINAANAVVQFPFAKHANTEHESASSTIRRAVSTDIFLGDMMYIVNASIGTPGQTVSLILSPSSSDTWVLDTRSQYCAYYSTYDDEADDSTDISQTTDCVWGTFSSNLSSSYTRQDSSNDDDDYYDYDFESSYTDGSYAWGDYFNDTISLGGAIVSDFTMALVNDTNMYIGVLGIGYNDTTYSNLPDRLQEQGLINSTAYSIWVDDERASSGNLLFGAIDTTRFDGNLTRVASYYGYSQMSIQIAGINGTTSDSNGPMAITYDYTDDTDDDSYYSSSSQSSDYLFVAIFSPPETFSTLPTEVASQIWDLAGAHYDSDMGLALIPCVAANKTTTNFTLQLGQGIYGPIITATMADLVIPADDGQMSSSYSSLYLPDDDELCLFGVQNSSMAGGYSPGSYILGSTLLRRTYTVFDLVNDQIAVAPVKFDATATSNIVAFPSYGASIPSSTLHCVYSDCYETTSDGTGSGDDSEYYNDRLPAGVLSVPALIGMSLGIGIGALLLGVIGFLVWRRRLNKNMASKEGPSVSSAETGVVPPLMQPSNPAGGPGAAPEMTQAAVPPAVVGGKGKEPEVPAPAALDSGEGSHQSSAAPETPVAPETFAAHDTSAVHDASAGHETATAYEAGGAVHDSGAAHSA